MTTITAEEKASLQGEWKTLIPDEDTKIKYGDALFSALFTRFPVYVEFFKSFKDKPLVEIREDKVFKAHCVRFINAFTGIIESLNNENALINKIETLASSHVKHQVTIEHFKNAFGVAYDVVSPLLQKEASRDALQKVFANAVPIMQPHLNY